MQTFFYVFGPFLLEAGLGLAAIILALGFVFKVMVPKARLMNQKHDQIDTAYRYADEAHQLICDLVVAIDSNHLLEDRMPTVLTNRINDLNRPILSSKEVEA